MMEPTSSTATHAALASTQAQQGGSFQVPKVIKDKADDITHRISSTDIKRINGYMRLANLIGALLLGVTAFIRMFTSSTYSHFIVVVFLIGMTVGLVFIENHEQFPSIAEKVKLNFGFMFTAMGKAAYILSIGFLSFSQGWIGCVLGAFFIVLALFNFFLIRRHPAYHTHMTNTQSTQQQADLESMPELRYNQAPVQTQAAPAAPASTTAAASHVVV
ncbi:hypothetical protein Poli38472_005114 [Pythium oligandrum]|uniref:COPI associated protein n=1 Tax=Pythium oligandrum TaxID=41045 RepID=A0A8K1CFH1_PYTOL|nr:hypothetical protein Poli38472_005114 [Pythium oligandrum]|eukprot:TMW62496.1 hypothetical protein Poli38472_005114 [Pythium oligandrum]